MGCRGVLEGVDLLEGWVCREGVYSVDCCGLGEEVECCGDVPAGEPAWRSLVVGLEEGEEGLGGGDGWGGGSKAFLVGSPQGLLD